MMNGITKDTSHRLVAVRIHRLGFTGDLDEWHYEYEGRRIATDGDD